MLIKVLIVVTLLAIVISLGSGMLFLVKDKGQTERTAKALTVRIVLSVSLFARHTSRRSQRLKKPEKKKRR